MKRYLIIFIIATIIFVSPLVYVPILKESILILSLVMCLLIFGWLKVSTITYLLQSGLTYPIATNIMLIVSVVFILLAVKCIFFTSREKNEKSDGILLENENGKLLISIQTIENIVKGVVNSFSDVKSSICNVKLDKQANNVKIDLNLKVGVGTVIKDISIQIQDKIKEVVKRTTELEIKEINIEIKDIENVKEEKNT